jgi:hypothetical protein
MSRQIRRTPSRLLIRARPGRLSLTACLAGALGWATARADPPTAAAPVVSAPAHSTAAAPLIRPASAPELDFDLLDTGHASTPPPSPAEARRQQHIERLVRLRRPMLLAHQALGFTTLAALTATVVVGQLNYYDKYMSGDYSGRYEAAHLGLGISTAILFGATGLLAVSAPNPYPKPVRLDTALVHKVSMALATASMLTQVVLGPLTASRVGRLDQADLAAAHLVAGYAAWAFMATGTVAYFF